METLLRRGQIIDQNERNNAIAIKAMVPLSEMFAMQQHLEVLLKEEKLCNADGSLAEVPYSIHRNY